MGTLAPTNWIREEKGSLSLLQVCRDVETARDDDAVASRKARASLHINAGGSEGPNKKCEWRKG